MHFTENGTYLGMDLGGTNFRIVRVDMKDGVATTDTKYYDLSKELLSGPSDGVIYKLGVGPFQGNELTCKRDNSVKVFLSLFQMGTTKFFIRKQFAPD